MFGRIHCGRVLLSALCVAGGLIGAAGCGASAREPRAEIEGVPAGLVGSVGPDDYKYLLDAVPPSGGEMTVDWPPPDRRRMLEVSLDVTGSFYKAAVRRGGRKIPLAFHATELFGQRLGHDVPLKHGDEVRLQTFGRFAVGEDAPARDELTVRIGPLALRGHARQLERRYGDVVFKVSEHRDRGTAPVMARQQIIDWLTTQLRQHAGQSYRTTPFLGHVHEVVTRDPPGRRPREYFFITDGWFQIESTNFSPAAYGQNTIAALKQHVERLDLRPFTAQAAPVRVMLVGLNDDGDRAFGVAQESFFKWYFEPQIVSFVR